MTCALFWAPWAIIPCANPLIFLSFLNGRMSPRSGVAKAASPLSYTLPAGGAGMHHPLLPHSSAQNASPDRDRRIIILRYMAAGEPHEEACVKHWSTGKLFHKHTFCVQRQAPPPEPVSSFVTI